MKTIWALAVALLITSTCVAAGKTKTSVISLGGKFCVQATVYVKNDVSVTASENDNCQTYIGEGFVGVVKGQGKIATIGGLSNQYPGDQITINLQYPFVTGGSYTVYYTTDGVTMSVLGSGTYTVE
jgi:hypothetical protein